jgi:hypothetical protein
MNATPEINPTPIYWDGESALFMTDSNTGNVHILKPSGFDIDEWFEEQKEASK